MVDPVTTRIWGYRAAFAALCALFAFFRLLPLDTTAGGLPGPDLMLALTFAWVLRRPAFVPPALIVAVFLLADLIFHRPPGLWTLLVLLGCEFLRARQALSRELPFPLEWGMAAVVMVGLMVANMALLALFMVPRPPLGVAVLQIGITIVTYPLVVAASHMLFGLRKAAPGEVDALGHRL
ncbi:rod shape-determining protein MreD [Vannielia litorea]|uniref:rod shape-determining protein MreD n=1 Tax=Vannielia TaxID=2813041 RepID=UPI001C955FA2|nr:rod shape-determining protein MreD [Vannielia litorea]MBY6048262.1 rod shape-determining protein MreD [Vannielia litorea]MBY6075676.1 rod shape-determining protein MreD [Vannielia litorea]